MAFFYLVIAILHGCFALSMETTFTECIKNKLTETQKNFSQNISFFELNNTIEWIIVAQKIASTQKKYNIFLHEHITNTKMALALYITQCTNYLENIQINIEYYKELNIQNNYRIARTLGAFLTKNNTPKDQKQKIKNLFFDLLESYANKQSKEAINTTNSYANFLPIIFTKHLFPEEQPNQKSKEPAYFFIENFFAGMIQDKGKNTISLTPKEFGQYSLYIKKNTIENINITCASGHFNSPKYAILALSEK